MAEFADLGKHCDIAECRKLDFLPFKCAACHHTYCLEHHAPSAHHCAIDITQHNLMPRCPVCSQHVYVQLNGSSDKILSEHIDSGCKMHLFAEHEKARAQHRAAKLHCNLPGCKNPNNYDTVQCRGCGLQHCLTHRSAEDHKCSHAHDKGAGAHKPSATAKSVLLDRFTAKPKPTAGSTDAANGNSTARHASAGAAANGAASGNGHAAAANSGAAATAKPASAAPVAADAKAGDAKGADAKAAAGNLEAQRKAQEREHRRVQQQLQLEKLKLKHKAVGDASVRDASRLYFWIAYPAMALGGGGPAAMKKGSPVAMWFDGNWTVGKALQLICNASDLENRNNKPNQKRLEVFCKRTGAMFPTDISLNLLEPDLMSGDTLDLRYV